MTKVIVVGKSTDIQKETVKLKSQNYRTGFLVRVFQIIADDIRNAIFRKKIVVEREPEGWEDYRRFCELARGKK